MNVHPFSSQAGYPAHVEVVRGNGATAGAPPSERPLASRETAGNGAMIHGNGEHGPATSNPHVTGEAAGQQTYAVLNNWTGAGIASDRAQAPVANGAGRGGTETPSGNRASFGVAASYASTPNGSLHADPAARGVFRSDNGQAFIKQGDQTYPVRYDKDNGTWRIHCPDNPAKYAYPVKQDESGNWRTHGDVGLPGGFSGAPPASIGWGRNAVLQLQQQMQHLQNQREQLQQEHQNLQSQLQQFPGPQHANRSPAELAQLQGMLQSQLGNVNHQRQAVDQQIQQINQQLLQLQNEPQH